MNEERRSVRRLLWVVLGVGGSIIALVAGIAITLRLQAGNRVEREHVKLKERIAALRAERVVRPVLFEPAEAGNAWDLHVKALEAIDALPESDRDVITEFQTGEGRPDLEKVDRILAAAQAHFDVLKAALHRAWVEPDYRWEQGMELDQPLNRLSIQGARFLAAAAKRRHQQGRDEEAIEHVLVGLGLADHMAVKGSLINGLVVIVCQSMAMDPLKEILSDHELPAATLERLARTLDRLDAARPDFQDCLRREDLLARSTMRGLEERGLAPATLRDIGSGYIAAARFYGVQDRFMEGLERIAQLPAWERPAAGSKLVDEIIKTKSPLHLVLIPQVGRAWRNMWLSSAEWPVARTAVAVAWHQAELGIDPVDLKGLVPKYLPKVPDDPCGTGPIRGIIQAGTVTVYSLGFNRVDDGGEPPEIELDDETGDILWNVMRRKAAAK